MKIKKSNKLINTYLYTYKGVKIMGEMGFNLLDIDILREIANIGTGNAATSLAKIVNKPIRMKVPEVDMPEFKNLADTLCGAETLVAGLLIYISGDINGMILYVTPESAACSLINHLMAKNRKNLSEFDDIDISALTEIGNILTSSYLTALSKLMNFTIKQSIPYMSIDMAGAILSVPAIEFGKVGDTVLLIKSNFNEDENLSGYFILIPDVEANKDVKL